MGTPSDSSRYRYNMSPHCLLACLLLLPAASQAARQERGLFGDVIGGILGGENATDAATTLAPTDAAPSDIVGTLMQVIPAILESNSNHRSCGRPWSSPSSPTDLLWKHVH